MSLPRPCLTCGALTQAGPRCPRHSSGWQSYRSHGSYGSRWAQIRAEVLASESNCRACGAPATAVDHILNRKRGGTDARDNLAPICKRCHARKTGREGALARQGAPEIPQEAVRALGPRQGSGGPSQSSPSPRPETGTPGQGARPQLNDRGVSGG